ncbi:MAG: N-acetylneuraminate synthase family protein [Treponema sp.]|jgi:sialic acid synthase SpsE|nr:N-acetylneuraminate synthase family protein [Treponema sp.]
MKNRNFMVDGREYGPRRVLVIAELGTSHGADRVKARELIAAAAESGAGCVKFQMVYADEILHPNTGEVLLPGGKIRLYDRFRQLELEPSFFAEMKEEVEKRGLLFLCTPFGLRSAREVRALGPRCIKIASPELNFSALLRELGGYGLPLLLSAGVSRLGDIEEALAVLREGEKPAPSICILHCVTAYPSPERDYNLRVLGNLGGVFGLPVGISDHSLDPELVPALGTAMGAAVVEKHFCLSRKDPGLDDPIALEPGPFRRMAEAIRRASEAGPEETLAFWSRERGSALVEAILGGGIKELAPSERANYERTRRSIHALRDIRAGEILGPGMFASLRTERVLRPGLPPAFEEKITGRRAAAFIPAGEGIRFEDL